MPRLLSQNEQRVSILSIPVLSVISYRNEKHKVTENPREFVYIYISILVAWSNYVKITIIVRFIVPWLRKRTHCNSWCNYHKYENWIPIESETRPFQTIVAIQHAFVLHLKLWVLKKTRRKGKIYNFFPIWLFQQQRINYSFSISFLSFLWIHIYIFSCFLEFIKNLVYQIF